MRFMSYRRLLLQSCAVMALTMSVVFLGARNLGQQGLGLEEPQLHALAGLLVVTSVGWFFFLGMAIYQLVKLLQDPWS